METDKYRALLTAIETGSLVGAAQKLGYTTSGLSRMMASLEEEMGTTLLNRSRNGVQPSSACEKLLPQIRLLLSCTHSLEEMAAALHGNVSGTVRIGTAYSYYYDALSKAVKQFAADYPDVNVEITSSYSSELARQLDHHELDLCIITRREFTGKWIPLCKDEMVAAICAKSPLASRKAFPITGFAVHPYIQPHPATDSDSARVLARHEVIPDTRYSTQDSMATLSMVAAGLGITMNNRINVTPWKREDIRILPLRPRQWQEIGLAISNEADTATLSFADTLQKYIKE